MRNHVENGFLPIFYSFSLALYSFFGWLSTAASNMGAVLLLFGAGLTLPDFLGQVKKQPLFWLSIVSIIFILLHLLFIQPLDQQTAIYSVRYSKGLVYLWLFSVIGWSLYKQLEMVRWLIGLASIGLVVKVLMEVDWDHLAVFFDRRQDFGFSWTGAGLHSVLGIFGFIILGAGISRNESCVVRCLANFICMAGILVLAEASVLAGSRAAWVAMLVAMIVVGTLFYVKEKNSRHRLKSRTVIIFGLIISLFVAGILAINHKRLSARLASESQVYGTLLTFDRKKIPYTSVGARAHMLLYGLQLWRQKPLFGWGVGSSRTLLARDRILKAGDHPHFHDNYLQLLVEQGLVGFSLYFIAFVMLLRGLLEANKVGAIPKDVFYYLIGAWTTVLVWSLADSRMVHADLRFVLLLLSGISFAYILKLNDVGLYRRSQKVDRVDPG